MTASLTVLSVAAFGLLIVTLDLIFSGDDRDSGRVVVTIFGDVPLLAAIAWMIFKAWRAKVRRGRMISALLASLSAHGQATTEIEAGDFPDIPIWIEGHRVYWAGEKDVAWQPIDQLLWAYAETFLLRRYYQLVIWNRNARAIVLPLRKQEIAPSLDRLRDAAPWLPIGYNRVMKECWNTDHQDFIALIDAHRQSGERFDAPWAGDGMAAVSARLGKEVESLAPGIAITERQEIQKALQRWHVEPDEA